MNRKQAIASARAYLSNPRFDSFADMTGIHPQGDWKHWKDSEGNLLRLTKTHTALVYAARTPIERTADLYRKAHPKLIAKHSYWVMALLGKDMSVLSFLGRDGLARVCVFKDEKWKENICPLLIGYIACQYICSGYLDSDVRKIECKRVVYPRELEIEESWVSGYPVNEKTLQEKIECLLTSQDLME